MYKAKRGDTLEDIARKVYGTPDAAGLLREANPGLSGDPSEGLTIVTPAPPGAYTPPTPSLAADNEDEVAVTINGRRFRRWSSVSITRNLDAIDTFSLSAPFQPDDPAWRDAFRPFSFQTVQVTVGGQPVFTGTAVSVTPSLSSDTKEVAMSGYSLPGVLTDCTQPASAYPIEFNGLRLIEIAQQICRPFGLTATDATEGGAAFERVAAGTSETGFNFLSTLAQQRSAVLGSTETGALEIRRTDEPGVPVARLREGQSPLVSVSPSFNPRQYYSHITGLEPAVVGIPGEQYTARNEFLAGTLRPHVFSATDADPGTLADTVDAKAARMFADMAAYSATVTTWRDANGAIWAPGAAVKMTAPGAMVYTDYKFQVRTVGLDMTHDKRTATIDLIMPGGYSGKQPERLPWDE